MLLHNKELRKGVTILAAAVALLSFLAAVFSLIAGCISFAVGCIFILIILFLERYRYSRLKKLSLDLDRLLIGGTPLPIRDYEAGELSVLANQIQKITQRLKEAAETVQQDRKFLADSLADISHQLRTPLTTMDLTTAILRDPRLTPEKRTALIDELRLLMRRTEWLVETLLKLSKLDAGTVTMQKESCPARELISRAAQPFAIPMELRRQKLQLNCGQEVFCGDIVWTGEALGNILKNCTEHTPEGGTITVSIGETPLFLQIDITDTGPGLDPKDIPHLFDRFYKGKHSSENSYGIGLSLARTVIRAQNGSIQALNTGTGAKFVIKFYKQVI